eukprot:6173786-Prymnesium_polylepis.1
MDSSPRPCKHLRTAPQREKAEGRAMVGSLPELPEDVLNPILAAAALGDMLGVLALAAAGRRAQQT